MGKLINVLAVCGSGTVSSSMVVYKLKKRLSAEGYFVRATEANPSRARYLAGLHTYDVMVHTTELPASEEEYGIPVLDARGFLSGMDEQGFMRKLMEILE